MNKIFQKPPKIAPYVLTSLLGLCFSLNAVSQDIEANTENSLGFKRHAIKLHSVLELKKALSEGASVTASMDLTQCSTAEGEPTRNAAGGLNISSFLIDRQGTLSFSSFRSTVSTRNGAAQAVSQTNRYRITPEGSVTLTSYLFSLPNYDLIFETDVICEFNKGFSFFINN